jgi:hypothetical protein
MSITIFIRDFQDPPIVLSTPTIVQSRWVDGYDISGYGCLDFWMGNDTQFEDDPAIASSM